MKRHIIITVAFVAALMFRAEASSRPVLVEAESFEDKGGWVVDHQAFEKIKSSYIMAHGLGRPVKDASTTVDFDVPGEYDVYVSTYNWTSPWYDGNGPGAFRIKVGNTLLEKELGTEGNKWNWQYAGKVKVGQHETVALHDLTGFNGRVDAIFFTNDGKAPEQDYLTFEKERDGYNNPGGVQDGGEYDFVVVGGGVAGCSTALTAARYGLKVAIIDNLPWLGGNNVLGVKSCGLMCENLYPRLGNITCQVIGADISRKNDRSAYFVRENGTGYIKEYVNPVGWNKIQNEIEPSTLIRQFDNLTEEEIAARDAHEKRYAINEYNRQKRGYERENLLKESGVAIFHNIHICSVASSDGKIVSVTGKNLRSGELTTFRGTLFADCTGDGVVGYLAGAEYMIGRESRDYADEPTAPAKADNKKMGMSMHWEACPRENSGTFPDVDEIPWAMQCSAAYYEDTSSFTWPWETGLEYDNALEAELVRDNYLRAVFGNWAYLKNHVDKYKNYRLDYLQHIGMKRESRRLVGALILNENDISGKVNYPDASFTTTWTMDLHYATGKNAANFPGWEWITYCTNEPEIWVQKYDVPYRCLYSKDIDNLFIGGRNMSVTHQALGTVRVQSTLGMAGEVIGMAASICVAKGAMPDDVYSKYLKDLIKLMKKGAPLSQ